MNYYSYLRRRSLELTSLKIKLQRLFSFLHYSDFDRVQQLLSEVDSILKKYDGIEK